jgi:hypothetical protein
MQRLQSNLQETKQPTGANVSGQIITERRSDERYSVLRRVIIIVEKSRYNGYTIDIARCGISFIAAGEIPLGAVELQIPDVRSFLSGKIVAVEESDPRRLRRYHVEFTAPLESAEIERIVTIQAQSDAHTAMQRER